MNKRAKYDPGPVVSRYAAVLCDEIAGQWCMREEEQQAAANLAPGLRTEVLSRCPTHGLLRHYGEIFAIPEYELTRRYEPLVTRRRWKALTEDKSRVPKILPRHFTTQYFGWQCMAIASSPESGDRGIYFATTDEIWKMDNEYDENSWRKIADIPRDVYYAKPGLAGMTVRCDSTEHALYVVTTRNESFVRCDLVGNDKRMWQGDVQYNNTELPTIACKMTFHLRDKMLMSSLCGVSRGGGAGNIRPCAMHVSLIDVPRPTQDPRSTYRLQFECARPYWFHSNRWIVFQNDVGTFLVIYVPDLLTQLDADGWIYDYSVGPFYVIPSSDGARMHRTEPGTHIDQFMVTDDGKLLVNNTSGIAVFQLDPVARSGQHIKNVGPISLETLWIGIAYSTDPEQRLIILANGVSDSLTLFDTAALEIVGNSFHCDAKMERTLAAHLRAAEAANDDDFAGPNFEVHAYVHRKRFLHAKGRLPTRCAEKDAERGEVTLNTLQLSYGNIAHVLFDRNRLILYGRNHYYMYTLTLGPPDY